MRKPSMNYLCRMFCSLFLCSAAVLGLFSIVAYLTFERVYTAGLRTQSLSTAQQVAGALDDAVDECARAVEALAKDSGVRAFLRGALDPDQELEVLRGLYAYKNGFQRQAALSVLSLSTGSGLFTGPENPKLSDPRYYQNWGAFRRANGTADVVVHTVSRDAVLDAATRVCVVLAVREAEESILGYVVAEIPRATLTAISGEYAAQYNTALLLVNGTRSVVYHSGGVALEGLGKLDALTGPEQTGPGSPYGALPGGGYVYSAAPAAGLTVLRELPNDIIPQLRKVLSSTAVAALGFSLPLCLALAYLIAQSVSRPVQRLKGSMEKVRHGDLRARVEVTGHDEISELGRSFNEMTARIESLVRHVEEKQRSLRVAEAKALSLQVNPHFIYNTLELIRWSAKMNKTDVAVSITVNFGKLLRRILNNQDEMVTVGYEMEMAGAYVEIQKQRYGDRLSVACDVPPELEAEPVPKLLLQPLLENAIVHGLEDKPGLGRVTLSVKAESGYLLFTVTDNGVGMSEETLERVRALKENGMYNIGLHNVHERAVIHGDGRCGLQINSILGEGTSILLTVKRRMDEDKEASDVQSDPGGG